MNFIFLFVFWKVIEDSLPCIFRNEFNIGSTGRWQMLGDLLTTILIKDYFAGTFNSEDVLL